MILQNLIGGGNDQLVIDEEAYTECHLCEKICAFNLFKAAYKEMGYLPDRDCLKCSECITVCPLKCTAVALEYTRY